MRRLHRLPYHPYQVVAQRVQVGLVSEFGREGFQGLGCVVLPAIEAPVYEGLDAASQGHEQRCYHKGGDHDGQLRLLLLACECTEECLNSTYTPEVEQSQHHCE